MTTKQYSRRNFLNRLGWVAGLGTFGGLTAASVRFMFPDVLYEPPKAYKIGGPQDYLDGVNYIPEKRIFVVRKGTLFKVISAVCTHIGCTVRWEADRNQWECPCHGSIFDDKGAVIVGPAPRPLPWYEVTLAANGRLFVNQRGIVPFSGTFSVKT